MSVTKTDDFVWYVVSCKSREESYVEELLNNQGVVTFRPVLSNLGGSFFSGLVFVFTRCSVGAIEAVVSLDSVTDVLSCKSGMPIIIPNNVIRGFLTGVSELRGGAERELDVCEGSLVLFDSSYDCKDAHERTALFKNNLLNNLSRSCKIA